MITTRKDLFDLAKSLGYVIDIQPPKKWGKLINLKAVLKHPSKKPFTVSEWVDGKGISMSNFYDSIYTKISENL
ncbi:hypothetical protein AGMMS50239_26550 [Bacteroidia bacterium]|nr:hypothetical protein FACS1894207_2820 [Bacteroidia bacterium]GHT65910.1 hypothetical protein AGMMS50239_26550 [Bacteroidia bacterium]